MTWLKEEGFGGIMVWSVDMDDFRGSCGTGKFPLMNAMRQELEGYTVKLEYDGPFESSHPSSSAYTTKDREYNQILENQNQIRIRDRVLFSLWRK
ncbi:endochitinase-like [Nilaparvata lugens]|uniref:endochitinase-like n=1 Tax=Nilaparvata lugens TaxID=108931 RepID=UPI00193E5F43|nr:endochitinase-like [Nilaparvata lugens]